MTRLEVSGEIFQKVAIFCCDAEDSFYECVDNRMIRGKLPRLLLVFVYPLLSFPLSTLYFPLSIENDTGQRGPLHLKKERAIVKVTDNPPLFHLGFIALSLAGDKEKPAKLTAVLVLH